MSKFEIGPLTILMTDDGPYQDVADIPARGKVNVEVHPATVIADGGISLDIRYCIADDGQGIVDCTSIEQSPEDFRRLTHGARLGVYVQDGGLCIRQLRVIRYSPDDQWGNPTLATMDELDDLAGGDAKRLLGSFGAQEVGKKSEVLGVRGNDLAVMWTESAGPQLPIVAYALTRILPILRVVQEA